MVTGASFRNPIQLPGLVFLFITGLVLGASADDWQRVSSKDGKISALFPVDIRENPQTQTDRTAAGRVTSIFGEYRSDGILLAASGAEIPRIARAAGSRAIFKGSKETFLEQAKGTEISFEEITVSGVAAQQLIYKGAAYQGKGVPYTGRAVFIVVDKRMYILNSVITQSTAETQAATKKMFDSIVVAE